MWEIDLAEQVYTVVLSLMTGAVFCVAFDVLTVFYDSFSIGKTAVFFFDILYFLILSVFDFCFFLVRSNGEIRGYVWIVQLIGFFLCRKTVSRIITPIMSVTFKALKNFFKLLKRVIITPISDFFIKIKGFAEKILKKSLKIYKKRLKSDDKLVYTKEKCPQDGI